jgi:hypothetical protein
MSNQSSSTKNMFFEEENVQQGRCVLLMMQVVTCGSVPLETSYQKVNRCIYTSTALYQCKCFFVRPGASKQHQCCSWGLRHVEVRLTASPWICYGKLVGWLQQSVLLSELYFIDFLHFSWSVCVSISGLTLPSDFWGCDLLIHHWSRTDSFLQRFVVDFYISDLQTGTRALVKSGCGASVTPYVEESVILDVNPKNKEQPADFIRWLSQRNLSADERVMQLREG